MRQRLDDPVLVAPQIVNNLKGNVVLQTLTGTMTLALPLAPIYSLDPGGAGRNLVMPDEAASKGVTLMIINSADAAEDITVKASGGSTTVGVISQSEGALAVCDGVRWKIMVNAET